MSKILKSFGLAALLVALLAGTGMADDTVATAVTGTLAASVTMTGPASVGFGTFTVDQANNKTTDAGITLADLSVTTNGAVNVQVAETGGDANDGKMEKVGALTTTLDRKLTIKADAETPVELTGTAQTIKALTETDTGITIDFGQYVKSSDTIGNYQITVTFSAVTA